jgi:hypothetical protein
VSLKINLKSIQITPTTFTFQPAPPLANNVPRPCAVAVYGKLICPAKIKINAKRNDEFKNDNGNGARPLLAVVILPIVFVQIVFVTKFSLIIDEFRKFQFVTEMKIKYDFKL